MVIGLNGNGSVMCLNMFHVKIREYLYGNVLIEQSPAKGKIFKPYVNSRKKQKMKKYEIPPDWHLK